jgi:hypothetical protein
MLAVVGLENSALLEFGLRPLRIVFPVGIADNSVFALIANIP